jgi:general L-amino acid transport system permease protein
MSAVRSRASGGVPLAWIGRSFFRNPFDALLTVAIVLLAAWLVPPAIHWLIVAATFAGDSRSACTGNGACWAFITANLGQIAYGFYPKAERWRVDLVALVSAAVIAAAPLILRRSLLGGGALVLALPIVVLVVLHGGVAGLVPVPTSQWSGFALTACVAAVGLIAALPVGVMLALGRQSHLPVFRIVSTVMIESWRGVPLVTLLFMASVMLPIITPDGITIDKLIRALAVIAIFNGAYLAEVVRGGLQAIPVGQYETARALGLGYWRMMGLVILPQALRLTIPGIVNTLVALIKDTTLLLTIGFLDLLGMIQALANNPQWLGSATEGYVVVAFVFWCLCYGLSRVSRSLETAEPGGPAR